MTDPYLAFLQRKIEQVPVQALTADRPATESEGASSLHEYCEFICAKRFADIASGFECTHENSALFPFQRAIVKWALRRGRAAVFADTGMGKTAMQCEWARRVCEHTGGRVLILAPLCVARQSVREAQKFGIPVRYLRSQSAVGPGITITNYEMMEHFDIASFAAWCSTRRA